MSRRTILLFAAVTLLGAAGGYALTHRDGASSEKKLGAPSTKAGASTSCEENVTKAELERSIELGEHFMLVHQKPAGNFDYEYDWKAKRNTDDDNAIRQSGALWGLGLLYRFHGSSKASPELAAALARGIAYFDDPSRTTRDGWRYPVYRGDVGDAASPPRSMGATGGMGMAALVPLAIIEYVRALPEGDAGAAERAKWTARANEYISFVAGSIQSDGLWPGDYRYDTGAATGAPSPYVDGEALLALVEAAKYLNRADLAPVIAKAATAGHRVNVEQARRLTADSSTTKGYYQWSSMAYYELATSSFGKTPGAPPYGDWLLNLADWILDVHDVLGRARNTGYAFEGIVSAYAWAKAVKDPRAEHYRCAIHRGFATLLSWQVGHPRAAALGGGDNPKAAGGVQNHATEPPLRIDVVQHQLHATMLADEHLF